MYRKPRGTLIIIGGGVTEDMKEDGAGRAIMQELSTRARKGGGAVGLVTASTHQPEETIQTYKKIFRDLGVERTEVIDIRSREDACLKENVDKLIKSTVIYLSGGDQLRLTSQVGDSPVFRCMKELYMDGTTIAGSSAGAAAMSDTMLIHGPDDETVELSALGMAPGLGFINGVVIDTHFAERGRLGRMLSAVAQNPATLGVGIDENTAIIVERGERFRVIGGGAAYVVDGTNLSYTNLSESRPEGVISIFGMKLDVLGVGDRYDLIERQPWSESGEKG